MKLHIDSYQSSGLKQRPWSCEAITVPAEPPCCMPSKDCNQVFFFFFLLWLALLFLFLISFVTVFLLCINRDLFVIVIEEVENV